MKIIALEAENLKRLTAVRIEPDGNLVQITGKNGQGKTSVLDAIWWALSGTSHVQTTPIRKGEERATIKLDLGDLKVTRTFIAQEDGTYTTSIKVENGEGARFQSPQTMLDKLLGHLTFDPLAFSRMKSADQVKALRSLVPDFDFAANEAAIKEAFDERTIVNREAKNAGSAAASLSMNLPEVLPEVIDTSDIAAQLEKAQKHNAEQSDLQAKINRAKDAHLAASSVVVRLQEQLKEAQQHEHEAAQAVQALPTEAEPQIDTGQIMEKMRAADAARDVIAKVKERDREAQRARDAAAKGQELTARIEDLKGEAAAAVAGVDLPVDGIQIHDGAVTLQGVPFEQASDAEQLSASIAIAMALNPKLKVIRVRDGSLLDQDAMRRLAAMADEHDYQIWIERVDSSGQVGFVLEDGHLKEGAARGPEAAPEEDTPKERKSPASGLSLI